ncbi:ATP-binding protein [Aquimarina litoralis]|uniref:histidine kinase n=2 Tax=Aquimarina litoralis TaxID=584605 RepID=A0ABN1J5C9_9FLAO
MIYKLSLLNYILSFMKGTLRILLFLFLSSGFSQNKIIDSIQNELRMNPTTTVKMKFYNQLSRALVNIDIVTSEKYNDSLFALSNKENDEKMKMNAVYNNGVLNRMKGDYSKAENFIEKYLAYTNKTKDSVEFVKSIYQLATVQVYQDKKEQALSTYLKAISYIENMKDMQLQKAKILNAIGVIYKNTSQYNKAKEYHISAANIAIAEKDSTLLSIVYNGLGLVSMKQDSTSKALGYFKKSLGIAEKTNNTRVKSYQYRNIGMIYSKNKDFTKAEEYLKKALVLRRKMNNKSAIGGSLSDLGNVYIETNKLDKAERYIKEALEIFRENKTVSNENLMYFYLSTIETKRGNHQKANELLHQYYTRKDSLESLELKEKLNDLDVKYETEKKDKEITKQQLELKSQEAKIQKQQSQNLIMAGLAIFLLLTSILIWFVYQQRQKRKDQEILTLKREQQVKTLESLIEGEEKERLRLAKELHDGVNVDLSAIKYKLTSLLERNNKVIHEAVAMIDKSCEQVRAISHNLVPPALQNFSLVETLQDYCSTTNSIQDIEVSFQTVGSVIEIPKKAEVNIFRIVQELVNNSLKHSQGSEIHVQLSYQENNTIQLTVEDNGIGFDTSETNIEGIGLQNINSRITYLNGKLDVTSDEQGTSYVIDINTKKLA